MSAAKRKKRVFTIMITVFACVAAVVFLLPTVLTIANSFMTSGEISVNYGAMLGNMTDDEKTYIS
ncbi:MAG: hypothetical protein LUG26_05415 [Ruminococcus sp.]|nr:hypothetical protein [Ruminococcus sp.]